MLVPVVVLLLVVEALQVVAVYQCLDRPHIETAASLVCHGHDITILLLLAAELPRYHLTRVRASDTHDVFSA